MFVIYIVLFIGILFISIILATILYYILYGSVMTFYFFANRKGIMKIFKKMGELEASCNQIGASIETQENNIKKIEDNIKKVKIYIEEIERKINQK